MTANILMGWENDTQCLFIFCIYLFVLYGFPPLYSTILKNKPPTTRKPVFNQINYYLEKCLLVTKMAN